MASASAFASFLSAGSGHPAWAVVAFGLFASTSYLLAEKGFK